MISTAFTTRRLFIAIPLLLASAFMPVSVQAETTDWVSNEGGRMRIVALAPDARGTVRGALQIEPKAGWITYWREPGDAGIPPHISFPETSDVSLSKISYPISRTSPLSKRRGTG